MPSTMSARRWDQFGRTEPATRAHLASMIEGRTGRGIGSQGTGSQSYAIAAVREEGFASCLVTAGWDSGWILPAMAGLVLRINACLLTMDLVGQPAGWLERAAAIWDLALRRRCHKRIVVPRAWIVVQAE